MGQHLILNALSINEAVDFIGGPNTNQTWEYVEGGIMFVDEQRSDAQCAALYSGYTPSGQDDFSYQSPPPAAVQQARQTLKAFWDANPASVTDTQSATLDRALLTMLRYKFREFTNE